MGISFVLVGRSVRRNAFRHWHGDRRRLRRGSIWRAGEGHIKLWFAVFFFAIGASLMRRWLISTELIRELGSAMFLPSLIGWASSIWSVVALMVLWYVLSGWNESRKSVGLLKF